MAERRMFSKTIISSARFLKMPISSQALYFHLGLNADDDGIVEGFPVMRMVGATEDDLRVLASKGFVTVLNEDLVTYIMDWNMHNKIRADRKVDSIYSGLLLQILPETKLIAPRERADVAKKKAAITADGQPMDVQWTAQDRLGKDSIVQESIGKENKADKPPRATRFTPPTFEEVQAYCTERKNNVDPERFIDFYASKGWMVGKNKMKDWKAAVRNWESRDKANKPQTGFVYNDSYEPGTSLEV